MSLRVAIQMDHVATIDIDGDSTFALALEAQTRGHELLHYEPNRLTMSDGNVIAKMEHLELRHERGNHFVLGEADYVNLLDVDIVLMRQDPPFDMAYITATHILERIHPKTLVVNNPVEVRNAPEKLFATKFPQFMPPTLITSDHEQIFDFRAQHKDLIIKPLYVRGT